MNTIFPSRFLFDEQQLKGAPKYSAHKTWDWTRRGQAIDEYYKVLPYWGV